MLKDIIVDSGKYFIGMAIVALVELIKTPLIASYYGPGIFGDYAIVYGAVFLIVMFSISWISATIVRFIPEYEKKNVAGFVENYVMIFAIKSIVFMTIVWFVVIYSLKSFFTPGFFSILLAGGPFSATLAMDRLFLSVLRAQRRPNKYLIYSIAQGFGGLILGVVFISIVKTGVEGFIWGQIIITLVFMPIFWFKYIKTSMNIKLLLNQKNKEFNLKLISYGLPVLGINILTWVMSTSDRFLIKLFTGNEAVGIYSAVYNISEKSIFLISYTLTMGFVPIIFRLWENEGEKAVKPMMRKIVKLYLLIAIPVSLAIILLGKSITEILFSKAYLPGYTAMPYIVIGALFIGLANVYTEVFTIKKETKKLLLCYLIAAATNVGLNLFFIPQYGYMGAAYSTLFGYIVFFLITYFYSRKLMIF